MKIAGTIQRHTLFESKYVTARNVDVWLPPGVSEKNEYSPVLYMHDGQNLFEPILSIGGKSWEIDKAITRLMSTKGLRGAIVVGVWNSDLRWREFMPQRAYESPALKIHHESFLNRAGGEPISDSYLRFIVEELKPFIDSKYKTLPDQQNTFVMGSSMGGLISLYAISEYPEVFYGAGCLSTNWPAGGHELVLEMAKALPDPKSHKLYFDYGTTGLDTLYEPFQKRMDEQLRTAGYTEKRNWITLKFEGANHSEAAWQTRVEIPLSFLFL